MLWLVLMVMFAQEENVQEESASFREAEAQWRTEHEDSMRADDSWLNLVGLFFLKDGANPFGTNQEFRISLPAFSTVEKSGVFYLEDGRVRYEMARAQRATVNGEFRNSGDLGMDEVMAHNHLRIFLLERDDRIALRVRDLRAKSYLDFESLNFYRPKRKYMIEAEYTPYDPPKTLAVTTVISSEIELLVPGMIRFTYEGRIFELMPTLETLDDEQWLVMFQDQTSGKTTYSGGRFLYVDPPSDGKIVLNFNRSINPPCAYTIYATCPLPPAENWMDMAVEAGERAYIIYEE